jgi:hypothetical protein
MIRRKLRDRVAFIKRKAKEAALAAKVVRMPEETLKLALGSAYDLIYPPTEQGEPSAAQLQASNPQAAQAAKEQVAEAQKTVEGAGAQPTTKGRTDEELLALAPEQENTLTDEELDRLTSLLESQ